MERYIALTKEDLPSSYELLEIPVVRTSQRNANQDWGQGLMRRALYFIEHHDTHAPVSGKPYGLVLIGYRTASDPDHFGMYCSRYYASLEEARLRAQLATWFYVLGDKQAENIVLSDHDFCCDLRVLELIQQAEAMGVSIKSDDLKRSSHSVSYPPSLAPLPTLEELKLLVFGGDNWRAQWDQTLPPDPLRLLVWMEDAQFPTIDWFATVRRVAATVADHTSGSPSSYVSDGLRLLRRFSLPVPLLAFTVMYEALVQRGEASFAGEDGLDWQRVDRNCIVWRGDPSPYAANVPICGCCGQPRMLSARCGGLTYGDWGDENHQRFMECPFDGYGCGGRSGSNRFDCCHCVAIWHLMYTRMEAGSPMGIQEIEDEIVRHHTLVAQTGGSLFLAKK